MSLNFRNIKITRIPTRRSTTSLSNFVDSDTKISSFNRLSAPSEKQLHTEGDLDLLSNVIDADNMKVSSITSLDEEYSFPDVSISETVSLTTKSKDVDTKSQTNWDFAKKTNMKGSTTTRTNMGSTMMSFNHPILTTCGTSQASILKSQMKNDEDICVSAFELTPTPQSRKNVDVITKDFSQLIDECRDFTKRVRKAGRRKTHLGSIQSLPENSESKLQVDTSSWKKDTDLVQQRKQVKEDVTKFRKKFQEEQKIQDTLKEICGNPWAEDGPDEKLNRIERILVKEPQTFRIKRNKTRFSQISDRLRTYDLASDMEKIDFKQPEAEPKPNKAFTVGRLTISSLEPREEKQSNSRTLGKPAKSLLRPGSASSNLPATSRNSDRPKTLQNFDIVEESSCSSDEASTLEPSHKNISLPAQTMSSVRVKRFSAKYRKKEIERFGYKIPMEEDKLKAWEDVPNFNLFKKKGHTSRRRHSTAYFE